MAIIQVNARTRVASPMPEKYFILFSQVNEFNYILRTIRIFEIGSQLPTNWRENCYAKHPKSIFLCHNKTRRKLDPSRNTNSTFRCETLDKTLKENIAEPHRNTAKLDPKTPTKPIQTCN